MSPKKTALLKRLSLSLIVLGVIGAGLADRAAAAEWAWLRPCTGEAQAECTLWLNHATPLPLLEVQHAAAALPSRYETFADSGSPSASIWYVNPTGLDRGQMAELEQGLVAAGQRFRSHQANGLYLAGPGLMGVATLDQPSSAFIAAAEDLKPLTGARVAVQLETIAQILGGAPQTRRTLFWLDPAFAVSTGEIERLRAVMQQEQVRLVAVRLMRGEVDRNQGAAISALASDTGGLYLERVQDGWSGALTGLAGYADNGGRLRFDVPASCGSQSFSFRASSANGENLTTEWTGQFRACPEPPPEALTNPANTETAAESQPVEAEPVPSDPEPTEVAATDQSNTSDAEASQEPAGAPPAEEAPAEEAPAVEAPEGETPTGAPPVEQPPEGETPTGDVLATGEVSADDAAEAELETESNAERPILQRWVLLAAGGGLALLVLLLVLLILRRRGAAATKRFGVLVQPHADGERRYPLDKTAIRIGRNKTCDIVLTDDAVSDMHAVIRLGRDGTVVIVDLNSLNGTQVNGVQQQQAVLHGGEIVEIGATRLRFERGG